MAARDFERQSPLRRLAEIGIFVAWYIALDWISYLQPLESAGITPWNPPPGLSLALLVRRGWRYTPVVFLAAFASEFIVRGLAANPARVALRSALLAIGYGALSAWIARRAPAGPDFRRVRDVAWFAGVVSAAVLAIGLGYVALLWAFGPLPPLSFPRQLLQFWVGDVIGIFVMTPALLVHRGGLRLYPRSEREWIAQACAIAGTLWLLWGVEADLAPRLFYLLFLPLVWIGVRNSIEGTTLALIGIQFGLIAGVELSGRSSEMILELQLLMLTLVFTGLFLGASVSEWRLTEAALRERQAELDETLKLAAATETASALAHELNQPLTAIASYVGASQLMLDRPLENRERLASALGAAGREASRAGDVIRRLRDFFRSGAKALERVPVRALVIDSVDAMRPSLEHHRIAIQVDCGPALGDVVVDRLQLESVLHQLLQNAIEAIADGASHAREVVIRARRSLDTVTLAVRDTGPGIDPELGDAIFSPFKTTKALGTGLGLAIGRTIVENHGGKLEYETSPQGATFVVTLPSAAAEGAP